VPEPRNQHRVFLVHDEFVIASSLAAIMRHQGFDARSFTNPMKALSVAVAKAPELLISDLAMPLLSGSELASQVRKCSPDCKALLFSAQGMNGTSVDNPPLPKGSLKDPSRKEIPTGLRESLGGFLLLAPFQQGSVHRRSGPRRPLGTAQTWCSNARTWLSFLQRQYNTAHPLSASRPEGRGLPRITGKYDRLGQRVQILTMLRRPPGLSKRVNADHEFAY
jgi:CheY-like chemotaxis protein